MEVQTTILLESWKREEAFRLLKRFRSPEYSIALAIIHSLAETSQCLTSDDVWDEWNRRGCQGRGNCWMGAAFKSAERAGWIVSNGTVERSRLAPKHRRNVQLWRSLLFLNGEECGLEPVEKSLEVPGGAE
jgi:hypothetical protein